MNKHEYVSCTETGTILCPDDNPPYYICDGSYLTKSDIDRWANELKADLEAIKKTIQEHKDQLNQLMRGKWQGMNEGVKMADKQTMTDMMLDLYNRFVDRITTSKMDDDKKTAILLGGTKALFEFKKYLLEVYEDE